MKKIRNNKMLKKRLDKWYSEAIFLNSLEERTNHFQQ